MITRKGSSAARKAISVAALVGGFALPANAGLKAALGDPHGVDVVYDGMVTMAITNTGDQQGSYQFIVRDHEGHYLIRGEEYRSDPEVFTLGPGETDRFTLRFRPGDEQEKIYICVEEAGHETANYRGRVCMRSVVWMGRVR